MPSGVAPNGRSRTILTSLCGCERVRDRPGNGHRVFDVDVFVDGDDHFADPIAVIEHRLHDAPRIVVVALFSS
jgi:hypothetical protein